MGVELRTNGLARLQGILNNRTMQNKFELVLKENAPAFMASILELYQSDSALQDCDPNKVVLEALKAATLKLPINKQLGFAYIVPYKKNGVMLPQFQLGYKGYIQLAQRTGQYKHINADIVCEGERVPALCTLSALEARRFGPFIVRAFPTEHDAQEPLGFLVRYAPTGETLLYATDTYYLRHTFPGVHYWLVECSFEEEIVDAQLSRGEIDEALARRLKRSHMSLRRLLDALRANDLRAARAVVLVHLSDARSDERAMIEAAQRASGVENVRAAHAGDVIPLELAPF